MAKSGVTRRAPRVHPLCTVCAAEGGLTGRAVGLLRGGLIGVVIEFMPKLSMQAVGVTFCRRSLDADF